MRRAADESKKSEGRGGEGGGGSYSKGHSEAIAVTVYGDCPVES
jgi:hypothetical protein